MNHKPIVGLVRDLLFRSKIDAAAGAASRDTVYASTLEVAAKRCAELTPEIVVVDLGTAPAPGETVAAIRAAAPSAKLIGFASHVDRDTLKAAREAGFEMVLSRGEFAARLPELLNH